ncbi:efflux RND transporter periplasmic adaptor subunit [Maridesulfovibrio sp.]|uniref:efflux RND transporter periplasmic adaptor subunit n=1 Tax=Maridesulfovibrio sp. TaxID=2795000 RepID=UPI002A18B02D|nr:efflux RND transporter periplasmic adaptor subunit [Maridesulfovibrio sp.]
MIKLIPALILIALQLAFVPAVFAGNSSLPSFPDFSEQDAKIDAESHKSPQSTYSVVFYPRKEVILSAEVESTVSHIAKEFGQSFKKGQVLIKLDPQIFIWRQDKAKAMHAEAAATFKVTEELYQDKSRSIIDLEKARAELSIAKANMRIAGKEVSFCTITAPYSGRVEKLLVDEREWVEAGTPLIKIVSDSVLLARTLVPWNVLKSFPIGKQVTIELTNGETVTGKVSHVGAVMDSASQTFEVKIEVPNSKRKLKCGMTGHIPMPVDEVATR